MLCDFCHEREAVFFIEQVNSTGKRKINICLECASARGITSDPNSIQKSVGTLFEELSRQIPCSSSDDARLCPVCGQNLGTIRKTGRPGCPECYSIFKKEISALLVAKGNNGGYTGTMPHRIAGFRSSLTDRVDLQAKLEESVKNEDYEKAAIYRDYLRALEKKSVSDGGEGQ